MRQSLRRRDCALDASSRVSMAANVEKHETTWSYKPCAFDRRSSESMVTIRSLTWRQRADAPPRRHHHELAERLDGFAKDTLQVPHRPA